MKTNTSALLLPSPSAGPTNSLVATNDLRDIKPPVPIPNAWIWVWSTLGLLALLALSYWAWRYWHKKRQQHAAAEKIVPPHEKARQKLREALAFIDQPRPFCILVSDTVRIYLEERFDLHAPERTTEEFLAELQDSYVLTPTQKETLADFLMRCDLVKFARYEPVQIELEALHKAAERLVNETEPPPPLAPGAQAIAAAVAPR
jgi:hypothetical protein